MLVAPVLYHAQGENERIYPMESVSLIDKASWCSAHPDFSTFTSDKTALLASAPVAFPKIRSQISTDDSDQPGITCRYV